MYYIGKYDSRFALERKMDRDEIINLLVTTPDLNDKREELIEYFRNATSTEYILDRYRLDADGNILRGDEIITAKTIYCGPGNVPMRPNRVRYILTYGEEPGGKVHRDEGGALYVA